MKDDDNCIARAVEAAQIAKGHGLVKDTFAMLVGAVQPPTQRQRLEALADTILGVALGAQVDLAWSDEHILDRCRDALRQIRRSLADADLTKRAERLSADIKAK